MRRLPIFIHGAILASELIFLLAFLHISKTTIKRQFIVNLDP